MKAKTRKKPRVNVVTLGCSKNIFDSEVLMGQLRANSHEVTHEADDSGARIVIINTCGFIESAKQESIDTILRYAEAREKGLLDKVMVTGCLSERYKDELKEEIPGVDAWFGTRDLPALLKTLKADYKKELVGEGLLTTPKNFAYFKISEGCDRPCSFCAIPLMRGKHISVPMEELVKRAADLAAGGVNELILIAQDSTYYGLDIYKKRTLATLLEKLSEVKGIEWIRIHYAFPAGFPEDVLDVMASNSKICKYLDIPLQHISTPVLERMRRGSTRESTTALIHKMREKVPGITIRSTFISGFPGETKEDHETLVSWLQEMRLDRVGVFTYSHEENTGAFEYEDDVPAKEKERRASEIMEAQREISLELNQSKINSVLKVLIDRPEGGLFIGRTEGDSPEVDNEVWVDAGKGHLRTGDFAEVRITGASDYDLRAVPVD